MKKQWASMQVVDNRPSVYGSLAIWGVLIAFTLLSWRLGHGWGGMDSSRVTAVILILAFIKIRWVMLYFMEIKEAPLYLRCLFESWCWVVCAVLIWLLVG